MLPVERQIKMVQILRERRSEDIMTLAKELGISPNTVRRDLKVLEADGYLVRVHGGATIKDDMTPGIVYDQRESKNVESKKLIGRQAAALIRDGETIILDSGTTTYWIPRYLGDQKGVTAITNDLQIGLELAKRPHVTSVMTGGILDSTYSLAGPLTERTYSGMRANKLFLSIMGISLEAGLTDGRMEQAVVKQRMMSIANEVILVADSSKLGVIKPYVVDQFSNVDRFITDDGFSEGALKEIERLGVDVQVVSLAESA